MRLGWSPLGEEGWTVIIVDNFNEPVTNSIEIAAGWVSRVSSLFPSH
jgi:hypothetical protein